MYPDYPYNSKYFSLDGEKIHYIDEGTGPVILMVHGNPTWSFYYRHLIAALKVNHRVIAVDNIGCGLSSKPHCYSYTLKQHIDNLEDLLKHLGINQFSLVVHDWGGAIGFGLASRAVDRLEKAVVLNTAAFRSSRIPLRINVCRLPVIGEIIVRLFNGFAWPATFMAVEEKLSSDIKKAYLAPYDSWKNRIAVHRFVRDIPLSESHISYSELVKIENSLGGMRDKEIPMKIIWGGKDFCFNDSFYEEWRKRFPYADHHYFDDAGHYVLEDKRDEILEICKGFFL